MLKTIPDFTSTCRDHLDLHSADQCFGAKHWWSGRRSQMHTTRTSRPQALTLRKLRCALFLSRMLASVDGICHIIIVCYSLFYIIVYHAGIHGLLCLVKRWSGFAFCPCACLVFSMSGCGRLGGRPLEGGIRKPTAVYPWCLMLRSVEATGSAAAGLVLSKSFSFLSLSRVPRSCHFGSLPAPMGEQMAARYDWIAGSRSGRRQRS